MSDGPRISRFKSVDADLEDAHQDPSTPQTRAPTYRLAFDDPEFLRREELRPMRLQLELLKPELVLSEQGVRSTVAMFGGARVPEPGGDAWAAKNETQRKNLTEMSRYYDEARAFARLCSTESLKQGGREFVVTTGGGPGVMEAGNRGAADVGAQSIGLSIVLPHENAPNPYVSPEFCFNFHYFAIRKMHFLMRAKAVAVFPGGYGTMDELFETLTLIQTGRMEKTPVLLFGEAFWRRIVDFEALADMGVVSPENLNLFTFVDDAEAAWKIIADHHGVG